MQRPIPRSEQIELGWIDEQRRPAPGFRTPDQGAATIVWAATSPRLADRSGVYGADCDLTPVAPSSHADVGVAPWALDPDEARRLWECSARVTDVEAGELV
ncbi:MAG: hypothetical protein K6T92_07375 [Candidatus Rokubacteria bacterium]|nr:hypothetical protein [Candidatus Rokubacteria bacterium]